MNQGWNQKRLCAGAAFTLIGLVAIYLALQLEIGTIRALGPGGFPLGLGVILTALGLAHVFTARAFGPGERVEFLKGLRPLLIPISVLLFGATIDRFGFVPAIVISTVVAGFAYRGRSLVELAILTIGMTVVSVALFVYLLSMYLPLFK